MGMFSGKAIIVTGGGSGMGKSAAQRFAEEGGRVCVVDLNRDGAEYTARAIRESGGEAFACRADIALEADNARMVAETVDRFGGLDVAFLNAGYLGPNLDFFETDAASFDLIMGVNLRGCFFGMQAAGRAMRPGGAVVVTASTASLAGNQYNAVYTGSKHGVLGLIKASTEAFAQKGLRINAICPGVVATPLIGMQEASDRPIPADALPQPPYSGVGRAQHIAELALFLASPRASFITGAAYIADGGLMSCIPTARI